MQATEFADYDALGLADLIRTGEISAREALACAIDSIESRNDAINAVTIRIFDDAEKRIERGLPEGPFRGVPFLVKDLVTTFRGLPLTKGCSALRNHIAHSDSVMARRFLATGLVPIAKTNTPEFGLMGVTEPKLFGPTRSPWDTDRTSGGSSGGSAAGVAAGLSPIASAGDGGGSIRIPASCCGIFGLKPSRGRTSSSPNSEGWQGASVEHVLSRSVRDSAAMLDATHGHDPGAPFVLAPPSNPYLKEVDTDPQPFRIGMTTRSPIGTPVAQDCIDAVTNAAELLQTLGHHVEEVNPDYDGMSLAQAYLLMYFGEVAAEVAELEPLIQRKPKPKDVETVTFTLGLLGQAYSAKDFVLARRSWNDSAQAMGEFHASYDFLLTPTMAVVPPKVGETMPGPLEIAILNVVNRLRAGRLLKLTGIVEKLALESMSKMPFTQLANMTGQPAMSVPLYWNEANIPIGVQFLAPNGREDLLFRLAGQLERVRPWAGKKPPLLNRSELV